jgi:hypothetical protein
MKKLIVLAVAAGVATAVSSADSADSLLASKFEEWFAEAKPVGDGLWVTDRNGCLYMVTQDVQGLKLVRMNDQSSKPVCRKRPGSEK